MAITSRVTQGPADLLI